MEKIRAAAAAGRHPRACQPGRPPAAAAATGRATAPCQRAARRGPPWPPRARAHEDKTSSGRGGRRRRRLPARPAPAAPCQWWCDADAAAHARRRMETRTSRGRGGRRRRACEPGRPPAAAAARRRGGRPHRARRGATRSTVAAPAGGVPPTHGGDAAAAAAPARGRRPRLVRRRGGGGTGAAAPAVRRAWPAPPFCGAETRRRPARGDTARPGATRRRRPSWRPVRVAPLAGWRGEGRGCPPVWIGVEEDGRPAAGRGCPPPAATSDVTRDTGAGGEARRRAAASLPPKGRAVAPKSRGGRVVAARGTTEPHGLGGKSASTVDLNHLTLYTRVLRRFSLLPGAPRWGAADADGARRGCRQQADGCRATGGGSDRRRQRPAPPAAPPRAGAVRFAWQSLRQ